MPHLFCKLIFKISLLTSLLATVAQQAFAWGPLGHSTVGMIAHAHLSPQAQAAIQKYLGEAKLSDVANWADSIKSGTGYQQAMWYHFEKIPDGTSYLENLQGMAEWQQKKGGMITAILVAEKILRDPQAPENEKVDALKFFVHFMGDLHQPLHTGRPEDNGGVKTKVTWFGKEMSLHKVWDSGMLVTGHGDMFQGKGPPEVVITAEDSVKIYTQYLIRKYSATPVDSTILLEEWLNESMVLRLPAYDLLSNNDQKNYQEQHLQVIDLQIYKAGIRLANYLNEIFQQTPVNQPMENLWKNIELLVGKLEQVISLRP